MGQTAHGVSGCVLSVDSCKVALARHVFETDAPFTNVDMANCTLLNASKNGDLDSIMKALSDGADVNTRLPMWIRSGSEDPHEFAVDSECEAVPMDEDKEPVDLKAPNPQASSLTPLMHAAFEGHAEAVELLLRSGAQVNLCEADGMQALHFAAMSSSINCFRLLLGAGANRVAQDNFGRDALEHSPVAKNAADPSKQEWLQLFEAALSTEKEIKTKLLISRTESLGSCSTMASIESKRVWTVGDE